MSSINDSGSRRKFIKGIAGTALAASVPEIIGASGTERKQELKLRDYRMQKRILALIFLPQEIIKKYC